MVEFKRLSKVDKEKEYDVLALRVVKAELGREPEKTLYVDITNDLEVIASARERKEHYNMAARSWLSSQLEKWNSQKYDKVDVAAVSSPLEFITGDTCLILNIERKDFVLEYFRNIPPEGWLSSGGCSTNLEELLNPRVIADRELVEEVIIGNGYGKFYFTLGEKEKLMENLNDWEIEPKAITPLGSKEFFPKQGQAQNLVIKTGVPEVKIRNIVIGVDRQNCSVCACIYRRAVLSGKLADYQIYDGERMEDGTLVKRAVRLIDPRNKSVAAIFVSGKNIFLKENKDLLLENIDLLKKGWNRPAAEELISIY